MTRQMQHRCSSSGPSPRLLHRPSDIGSSFCWAGIAGEIVLFNCTFNPVLGHAIGISRDTERYISSGGPILVLDRRSESLKGQIR
jgi:hypothetical protein